LYYLRNLSGKAARIKEIRRWPWKSVFNTGFFLCNSI
jgi:hypothetical protein